MGSPIASDVRHRAQVPGRRARTLSGNLLPSQQGRDQFLGRPAVVVGAACEAASLVLDLASRSDPVETAISSSRVWTVGVRARLGQERELTAPRSTVGSGTPGGAHPSLLGLPPGPQLALDGVTGGTSAEPAVDVELDGGGSTVVDGSASPSVPAVHEDAGMSESVEGATCLVDGAAGVPGDRVGGERFACGAGVEVPGVESEPRSQREQVVCSVRGSRREACEKGGSLGGPGPCGARVRL